MSTIQSTDVPTLNQNTTGTAANVTGLVAIANGGTGQNAKAAGFNALSPITSTGDLIIGTGVNTSSRLPISATVGHVLTSTGTTASWQAPTSSGVTSVSVTAPVVDTGTASIPNIGVNSSSANTNNFLVRRDASGNFSASNITASQYTIDANYNLTLAASNPTVSFDANDFLSYDRTANQYNFQIGGSGVLASNATALQSFKPIRIQGSTSGYVGFAAQATAGTTTYTWPTAPVVDYFLKTDASGNLSWAAAGGGGGTPANPANSIQFNNGGAFGGSANLTWDGTNVQIGAAGALRFADTDNSNYVAFKAPGTVASNVTWTLPATDGTSNQVLSTNGSGTLSWATPSGGSSGPILESQIVISQNYTLTSNTNGFSVGPVSVATGFAVTVGTGQTWLVSQ
jgi:hypothetical protein